MPGTFKIKILWIGLLLAFPPVAVWVLRGHDDSPASPPAAVTETAESPRIQLPVEIVTKDGKVEWIMVEIAADAIPEPGTATLLMAFSSLLLLRRKREE